MISHIHRSIFIHIPKCGGQSVEQAFLRDLGLTWRQRAPLLLRQRFEDEKAPPRLAHLLATDYIDGLYISKDLFDSYFKFSVVRNPFERIVSAYNYLDINEGLYNFLLAAQKKNFSNDGVWWFLKPQAEYVIGSEGQLLVDEIIHFEKLNQAWSEISKRLNLKSSDLPYRNKTKKSKLRSSDLTYKEMQLIRDIYKLDFKYFNYSMV